MKKPAETLSESKVKFINRILERVWFNQFHIQRP